MELESEFKHDLGFNFMKFLRGLFGKKLLVIGMIDIDKAANMIQGLTERKTTPFIQEAPTKVLPAATNTAAVILYHRNIYQQYKKEWVDDCVKSIINQTHKDYVVYELNYGNDYTRLYEGSEYEQKPMRNFIEAMNYLLDKVFAAGHNICFNTNLDDIYAPERFALQIAEVEKGADLVSSDFRRVGRINEDFIFHDKNIAEELAKTPPHNILCHPVICYTREFWQKYGPYNPDSVRYEDMELWQKAVKGGAKIHIVPKVLATLLVHDKNVGTIGEEDNLKKQTNEQPSGTTAN